MPKKHTEASLAIIRANSARVEKACRSAAAQRNFQMYGVRAPYCPSPEDIRRDSAEIRDGWSEMELARRDCIASREPYEIPCVSAYHSDGAPIFVPAQQLRCRDEEEDEG